MYLSRSQEVLGSITTGAILLHLLCFMLCGVNQAKNVNMILSRKPSMPPLSSSFPIDECTNSTQQQQY